MNGKAILLAAVGTFGLCGAPALADGQVRIVQSDGSAQDYPGVRIIDTSGALYLRDDSAHETLIVTKSKCTAAGALRSCTIASVVWDRYGVLTKFSIGKTRYYENRGTATAAIAGTDISLTPNTVALEFTTAKGTYIRAFGYIDEG